VQDAKCQIIWVCLCFHTSGCMIHFFAVEKVCKLLACHKHHLVSVMWALKKKDNTMHLHNRFKEIVLTMQLLYIPIPCLYTIAQAQENGRFRLDFASASLVFNQILSGKIVFLAPMVHLSTCSLCMKNEVVMNTVSLFATSWCCFSCIV